MSNESNNSTKQKRKSEPAEQPAPTRPSALSTVLEYAKDAACYLGLSRKASAIAALCGIVLLATIVAFAANAVAPKAPNNLPLTSTFTQQAAKTASTIESTATAAKASCLAKQLTPNTLNGVDAHANEPGTFSLVGEEAAELPQESVRALEDVLAGFEGNGYTVGFMLINLNTGKGISYDLDSRVYGASSFKGPYATYLCQHIGDNDASFPQGAQDGGAGISQRADSLMQDMIVNSDNTAFSTLRNSYDSSGFSEWLAACGVDSAIMHDTHFPRYSARESALLWLRTYQYLKTETPTAQHLASLYAKTNVSFIRSGVGGTEGVQTVLNKAGWCASGQRFTGLCDAGLIECTDGTTYLMSTMTNAPDGGLYTVRLANLASTLFGCRGVLD